MRQKKKKKSVLKQPIWRSQFVIATVFFLKGFTVYPAWVGCAASPSLLWSQLLCALFNKLAVSISQTCSSCGSTVDTPTCLSVFSPAFILRHLCLPVSSLQISLSLYAIRQRPLRNVNYNFPRRPEMNWTIHFRKFRSDRSAPEWRGWISDRLAGYGAGVVWGPIDFCFTVVLLRPLPDDSGVSVT